MMTATIYFAIAIKRLGDRRGQSDSEDEDDERDRKYQGEVIIEKGKIMR